MTYVYFLLLSNGDIYKGSTDNLDRRIQEHHAGKVESTKNYRLLALLGFEGYSMASDARRREKFLKTTEGKRLLRQQYKDAIESKLQ